MIVPDLSKTRKSSQKIEATETTPTGTPLLTPVNASGFGRRRRRPESTSSFFVASSSPGRSLPATRQVGSNFYKRQQCASGLTYYACSNGFTGCCQGNPCTSTASCANEQPESNTSTTQSRTSTAQSTRTGTGTATATNNSGTRTATGSATTSTGSGAATSSAASSTITAAVETPAPTCPSAPSNFTDNLDIAYQVKCNIESTNPVNSTIAVTEGGYAQCMSVCSTSTDCAGFVFRGNNMTNTSAGECDIRANMTSEYEISVGGYSVAVYKIDRNAVPNPSASATAAPDAGSSSNVGAIAGGVVGGVAGLCIILGLLFFLIRRHRKKVDARREAEKATTLPTSNPAPTWEDQQHQQHMAVGGHTHRRSASTANDVYTPQGGYPNPNPPFTGGVDANTNKQADFFSELEGHSSTPPGLRAEGGRRIPAGVLRPPQMLDGRAVPEQAEMPGSTPTAAAAAASRSSVFLEHMSEMEDTSGGRPTTSIVSPYSSKAGESPTLGHPSGTPTSLADETRRKQHLLYWNNYDSSEGLDDQGGGGAGPMAATMTPKTPPSSRKAQATVSPDNTNVPRDSSFVVSPLKVRKSEQGSDPSGPSKGQ